MKVTVVGGWDTDESKNKEWKLELDNAKKDELKEFCLTLGQSLATKRHTVFIGSDDKEKSADYYVVQGMLRQLAQQGSPERLVRVIQRIESNKDLYSAEQKDERLKRFFGPYVPPPAEKWPRAAAKIFSVLGADVVIAIAGLSDTYIAGIAALVARKPLVPIGVFGGASRELLDALKSLSKVEARDDWDQLYYSSLDDSFMETVLRLGGLDRPRVFLGYCGQARATALGIKHYLESELGLDVKDWATDFQTGRVILTEIQAAARSCKYGVFLFTPDDTVVAGTETYKVPRANVVFEAGYFMNAHGPERTLIIVQEGTRVLADYGGYIYPSLKDGIDVSPIKDRLRETFREDLPRPPSKQR
jgi:hypothetical protein